MKLDKIIDKGTLPSGEQRVAAIPYRYEKTKRGSAWLESVPRGRVQGRSLTTDTWTAVLASDAISAGAPIVRIDTLTVPA